MTKYPLTISMTIAIAALLGSCKPNNDETAPLNDMIVQIKKQYAPDKRTALFEVHATANGDHPIIKGESNVPQAVSALKRQLAFENIHFLDSIRLLPGNDLNGMTKGLVTLSVANLRSRPAHSAELATQAILGTPLDILKKEGDWALVQTPDLYLAWVDAGGIIELSESDFQKWKSADKVIYTQLNGYAYSRPNEHSQVVSDLVAGAILQIENQSENFYSVQLPDGRKAFVSRLQSQEYGHWAQALEPTGESLVNTALTMMGLPYLWGGTSPKGVDCSGFTKTIYFLNGQIIPRDASQQVTTGIPIDSTRDFEQLQKGDLLFFGRKATDTTAEKVVHVGMWIGNNEFIHASGRVRTSSMDEKAENFDVFNADRYLRTKRILGERDPALIDLNVTKVFKD
jgi:cell wall-associated NlpC family hydrolase